MMELKGKLELMDKITRWSENTAPVVVSIGYVKDQHCFKGVVIKECPPVIIDRLIQDGYSLSMTNEGLLVDKIKS